VSSKLVVGADVVGPWVAKKCRMIWTPENSQALGLERDGRLVAGVWYEDYNQRSVTAHIAIEGHMSRDFLFSIFDYPFNQMGVSKIVCPVLEDNEESLNLVQKFGFTESARLKDIHPAGDMIFYVMGKENCKYIGERYGQRLTRSAASA